MPDLFAVAPLIARIAALSQRVRFGLALEIRAGHIVKQQVVLQIEQLAQPLFQMDFQRLFVRQQLIQRAIKPIVVHAFDRHAQEFRQRGFGIPLLGGVKLAGGFQESSDNQNQRAQ